MKIAIYNGRGARAADEQSQRQCQASGLSLPFSIARPKAIHKIYAMPMNDVMYSCALAEKPCLYGQNRWYVLNRRDGGQDGPLRMAQEPDNIRCY